MKTFILTLTLFLIGCTAEHPINKVKPSQKVRLRSGGPLMTVGHISIDGYAKCYWSNIYGFQDEKEIHTSALVVVSD